MQKVKVKVNWSRVKVNGYWSGSGHGLSSRADDVIYDVSLTWLMTCLGLMWLLTWSDDVIK